MNPRKFRVWLLCIAVSTTCACAIQAPRQTPDEQSHFVTSTILDTAANEQILLQEVFISAPVEAVWDAYTTDDGWTAWASPKAKIDLRVGGTIRTAYAGEVGDPGTITLHIINYVPQQLITLKTDVSQNWPEVMKNDADNLSNVVLFEELEPNTTRIRSYGIGYSNAPEYERLMQFFVSANEGLYGTLRTYLEEGTRANWEQSQ